MKVFPESISHVASQIDNLFWIITAVTAIAAVITLFLFIFPMFTRNSSRTKEQLYMKGNTHKKRMWIYIGMILLFMGDIYILLAEHHIWHNVEQTVPEADFKVAIVGKQWMWMIYYPGPDGELYTADDVMAVNELHLPANKNVVLDLKAVDVLHSVFFPQARFKQDVLPGRTITRWVNLNKEGKFDISCAEICGIGHTIMRGDLYVENEAKWQESMDKIYGIKK